MDKENKKSVEFFDIKGMSLATNFSEVKIRGILGMSLGKDRIYANTKEARTAFYLAKRGTFKKEKAFQAWVELFLKDVSLVSNCQDALVLNEDVPDDANAKRAVLKAIAGFYGFNEFTSVGERLRNATTLRKAIRVAFDYLDCEKSFLGPKGKLEIFRNSVEKGPSAEVSVCSSNQSDNRVLFTAHWQEQTKSFKIKANWREAGEKLSKWNKEW